MKNYKISKNVEEILNGYVRLVIGGKFVKLESGKTFGCISPANGEVLATVYEAEKPDVDKAVRGAKEAFGHENWSDLTTLQRGNLMFRLAQLIEEHRQEI